ncbi:MAG: MoxR family ATPase [Deltaproteobacteria bacterium]|nr:MoxR family ATPase [Deltaproteobacteria bacterium]
MFESVESVQQELADLNYICDANIATVVFLAQRLEKPVLVEGPAGVGKTELAKAVAAATQSQLIRLQCYEGLDEAKALYEWEYSKQLLYTQILKERFSDVMSGAKTVREAAERVGKEDSVFFSENFLVPRPLLNAITADVPTLLLIDEVDKGDPEFEAFLLEVLSDFQVTVPELGTIQATQRPLVFLTSNNSREMSDALKRRCLHLFIDFPNESLETRILEAKVPEAGKKLSADLVRMMQELRELDLKKTPSISETLDWARALLALNAKELDRDVVTRTLNVILKYEGDVRKAEGELDKILAKRAEGQRPDAAAAAGSPARGAGKDAPHQA